MTNTAAWRKLAEETIHSYRDYGTLHEQDLAKDLLQACDEISRMAAALEALRIAAQPAANIMFNVRHEGCLLDDFQRAIIAETLKPLDAALHRAAQVRKGEG